MHHNATAGHVVYEVVELHFQVSDASAYKVLPHAGAKYAVSAAVRSSSPLDVNLGLFGLLGRLALRGLWLMWGEPRSPALPGPLPDGGSDRRIHELAERVCALVATNPALQCPVSDDQAVDLGLAFMLLGAHVPARPALRDWISEIVDRARYAFIHHKVYPCIHSDYRDLVEHPGEATEQHRKEATAASVLWPTLAFWARALGDAETSGKIAAFCRDSLGHCTFQLWLPDETSEDLFYTDSERHGAAFTDIPVADGPDETVAYVRLECGAETPFFRLSAMRLHHWPLVATACRHYRLPVPPHLWLGYLPDVTAASGDATPDPCSRP